ncbi:MAG: hypothetical protein ACREQ5_04255 [Candidatus Dormibacteria bacterium]
MIYYILPAVVLFIASLGLGSLALYEHTKLALEEQTCQTVNQQQETAVKQLQDQISTLQQEKKDAIKARQKADKQLDVDIKYLSILSKNRNASIQKIITVDKECSAWANQSVCPSISRLYQSTSKD